MSVVELGPVAAVTAISTVETHTDGTTTLTAAVGDYTFDANGAGLTSVNAGQTERLGLPGGPAAGTPLVFFGTKTSTEHFGFVVNFTGYAELVCEFQLLWGALTTGADAIPWILCNETSKTLTNPPAPTKAGPEFFGVYAANYANTVVVRYSGPVERGERFWPWRKSLVAGDGAQTVFITCSVRRVY